MTSLPTTGPRAAVVRFVFAALLVMTALQSGIAAAQAPSRVDLVALMVEFQPDTTRYTTGNGTFAGPLFEGVDAPRIDPLPHTPDYFRAHLSFLENYVHHASDGRTQLTTHLLPEVIRVSMPMGTYSPTGLDADSDEELSKLSSLIQEAWTRADESGMAIPAGLDPSTTSFLVFHAGVGRDIELVGTTLDKTPEDLPSIFFDAATLERLGAGALSMDGFPVTNSMVIPRTESRRGVDVLTGEPFLIELSINGLLAASFFNYLGVPDLFDTTTGESAIGPFGLMDAQGIFAYSGLFPPEPSAWTKQFLGWADPVVAAPDGLVRLKASGRDDANESARVPISDAEYFLVENRHRDPSGDGLRMQIWTHEGLGEVAFQNGDTQFNDQTVAGFPGGVVLGVDDYDFALPGGLDEDENPLLGGILIWHVDENRLADGMGENAVNADRNARSIDLEEADGAQDIGFPSAAGFFGPRFDLGTPFDFWFEGNPVTVRTSAGRDIQLYDNRFAADTHPSNISNAGVAPGFGLVDFSAPGPLMTFRIEAAETLGPKLLAEWQLDRWATENGVETPTGGAVWSVADPEGFFVWYRTGGDEGTWLWQPVDGRACSAMTPGRRPVFDGQYLYAVGDGALLRITPQPDECLVERLREFPPGLISLTTSAVMGPSGGAAPMILLGMDLDAGPALWVVHPGDGTAEVRPMPSQVDRVLVRDDQGQDIVLLSDRGVLDGEGTVLIAFENQQWSDAVLTSSSSGWTLAWASENEEIHLLSMDGERFGTTAPGACLPQKLRWFDVDQDGVADLIYLCGDRMVAMHATGAILAGFPVRLPSTPLSEPVLATTTSGRVRIFVMLAGGGLASLEVEEGGVRMVDGHPLPVGGRSGVAPLLTQRALVTLSGAGTLRVWEASLDVTSHVTDDTIMYVPASDVAVEPSPGLLRASETYNWPNPITEGQTRIRFATSEPSDIRIDIVDMNGLLVDRIDTTSPGAGLPAEAIWTTNAGSGVYLARVRATSLSGQTDTHLVRMAIIR